MTDLVRIRGRDVGSEELEQIRNWLRSQPQWSRRRLSQELARQWDWRTPTGQLKDIAARDLLNRLEVRGLIVLPARQRRGGRQRPHAVGSDPQTGLALPGPTIVQSQSLAQLLPLSWHLAQSGEPQRAWVARCLDQHHYLGYPDPLGQLHYLVRDHCGQIVACLLFGA